MSNLSIQSPAPEGTGHSTIPAPIAAYFAEHTTAGMPVMAALLEMDVKTLRRHVVAGELVGRIKGVGRVHPRRVFTLDDTIRFLTRPPQKAPECPSTGPKVRDTTSLTSECAVLAFTGQRRPTLNMRPAPSKKPKR
jgi:hypothetical protein